MTDEEFIARIRATPTLLSIMLQIDDALEARDKEVAERSARIAELEAALNGWQKWWELPWRDRRPDVADLRYRAARAALNGEKK